MEENKTDGAYTPSFSSVELERMAQDAGFVMNMVGELGTPAPTYDATKLLVRFAELVAGAEREAAKLRCANTPVLHAGLHEYTALKVQEMMMAAVSMRSNVQSKWRAACGTSKRLQGAV